VEVPGVIRKLEHVASAQPGGRNPTAEPFLVGRDAELAQLDRYWTTALTGTRQIVFLSGEPGIGKTALINAFVKRLREQPDVLLVHGQCVEQYGVGEAYLPLLEATTRFCRGPDRAQRIEAINQYAPSWLAQMPSLLEPGEFERLRERVQGTSRERMLREMAEATELFTTQRGGVIVLEDLHWSDVSTLDWLTYIARRREPTKLLILGTYRPAEILVSNHPLRAMVQELQPRRQCEEIRLAPLGEKAITAYLTKRFGEQPEPSALASTLTRRTGGNPLFIVNTVDYLVEQKIVTEESGRWTVHTDKVKEVSEVIPDTLRQLIERQVERLSDEDQRALEVASIVGGEFSVAEAAVGLPGDLEACELQYEHLARIGQFLRTEGVAEWPDGTLSGRYSFLHAVYHEVIATRVGAARRIQLHRRIAERKETAYGPRTPEVAAELAVHFEQGREYRKAVQYHEQAAQHAMRRNAAHEAIAHLTNSLSLLEHLPENSARAQQELAVHVALGPAFIAAKGNAAPEVERTYARAHELCRHVGESPQLFRTLLGLRSFHLVRGEIQTAHAFGDELSTLARNLNDQDLILEAAMALGNTSFLLGDLSASLAQHDHALRLYDSQRHHEHRALYGLDPAAFCLSRGGWTLWLLGYPDQAETRLRAALQLAEELAHPFSSVVVLLGIASVHLVRQEGAAAQASAEQAIALARAHGFLALEAQSAIYRGRALSVQGHLTEGIAQVQQAIAALRATGAQLFYPYSLALLAEAYAQARQPLNGLAVLSEALASVQHTEERFYEAELYRLKGELTLVEAGGWGREFGVEESPKSENPDSHSHIPDPVAEAEGYFHKALAIARQQHAKSLELRAATSLARLWRSQDRGDDARALLQGIHDWFTEGFATNDLQAAKALIVTLGGTAEKTEDKKGTNGRAGERESGRQEDNTFITQSCPLPQSPTPNTFRAEGEYWTVVFHEETVRIKDTRGMRHLAYLLRHPDREFSVLALAADPPAPSTSSLTGIRLLGETRDPATAPVHIVGFTDAGEILDSQAKTAYRQRLTELQAELDEAREFNDVGRVEKLQDELYFVTQELVGAVGLGKRARKAASPQERARVNVTRAIRTAITRITEVHPALGLYLSQTIKTGAFCSYVPPPHIGLTWQF
jgi:predicted ATPase